MFNIYTKIPAGIIHPYWGFGLGLCSSDMSEKATEWFGGHDTTSFVWQLLTMVEIDLANNLAVDISYHYFATEPEFKNDTEYEHGNNRDVDFTSSMINI